MKDKLKMILEYSLPIYIILNLLYLLIGSYLIRIGIIWVKAFSYGHIVMLILSFIISIILIMKDKYKFHKIDIFLLLIMILATISMVFAYKPEKALFGEWGRYEGLLTICYYMFTLFLCSFVKKEHKKIIVYAILSFGFIQVVYGLFQKFHLLGIEPVMNYKEEWITGLTMNPNFFGTLMLICLSYSIGLFMDDENPILYIGAILLFLIGLLLSNTLSCVIGLIFVLLYLLLYTIKNKYYKKLFIILGIVLFAFTISHIFGVTRLVNDLVKTKNETVEISKGNVDNDYGTGRVELWKKTIKVVPKYLLHGVGVDNFANIIDGRAIMRNHKYYDKAHNEYLQILVTMGIFSLISYLCLHFIIIKNGIKDSFKNKEVYLLLPVIGYLVQAQFNISVIDIAPLFYIGLGLLVERNEKIIKADK